MIEDGYGGPGADIFAIKPILVDGVADHLQDPVQTALEERSLDVLQWQSTV